MSTRTSSYLLGNKGCHSYNGNSKERRKEFTLDEKTEELIKKRVHESVGQIVLPDCTGTGFRVGTKYLMSTFHIFREQIWYMIEYIAIIYCGMKPENEETYEELERTLDVKRKTNDTEFMKVVQCLLRDYLVKHSFNIQSLLDQFERQILKAHTAELFSNMWKSCLVEFSKGERFYLDYNITFGDEEHDVIIVELKNENPQEEPFPPALLMDNIYRPMEDIQIVQFKTEEIYLEDTVNETIVSEKCYLFDENFQEVRQSCIDWWRSLEGIENYIGEEAIDFQYHFESDCPSPYNKTTGVLITKASRSFTEGSAGSPMLFCGSDGPIVTGVLQGVIPTFYNKRWFTSYFYMYDDTINDDICRVHLFRKGLTMEKVAELLHLYKKDDLKENIFKHLKQDAEELRTTMMLTVGSWKRKDATCFVTKGVRATTEQIQSNNWVWVTGDPGSGKSMAIIHAALHLKETLDFTVYPISSSDEFFEYLDKKRSQVFVIDDIFGKHAVCKDVMDKWLLHHDVIEKHLNSERKILISLRTHLVQDKLDNYNLFTKSKRTDLSDKRYKLDNEEMKGMLSWLCFVYKVENVEAIISKLGGPSWSNDMNTLNSFPLLCKMFCSVKEFTIDPKRFFSDPLPAFIETFKNMKRKHTLLFCGLVLCVAFDGTLSRDTLSTLAQFTGELDSKTIELRDNIMISLGLTPESNLDGVFSALNEADDVYVMKNGQDFKISQRIVHDIVTYVYGYKWFIFKHGTKYFIKDRVRLEKTDHCKFVVVCGCKYIETLAKRMTDDFKNMLTVSGISDVETKILQAASLIVEFPNIDDERLIDCLRDTNLDRKAVNILFKQCFFVVQKSYHSFDESSDRDVFILQYNLIRLLLELGADCNTRIGDSWPLHISVNANSVQLTRLLLEQGADIRICNRECRSVLQLACLAKRNALPIVSLFVEKGIDNVPAVSVLGVGKHQICVWLESNKTIKLPNKDILSLQLEEIPNSSDRVLPSDIADMYRFVDNYSEANTLQLVGILNHSCLNSVSVDGQNALHLAVRFSEASVVSKLLELGTKLACKNNVDYQKRTPEDWLDDDGVIINRKEKIEIFGQFNKLN